jgi:hypothetical protein
MLEAAVAPASPILESLFSWSATPATPAISDRLIPPKKSKKFDIIILCYYRPSSFQDREI